MNRPGLQFWAEPIDHVYTRVRPHNHIVRPVGQPELEPRNNELYIVCKDGSVQSVFDPELSIGWELIEQNDEWFYRVNSPEQTLKRCLVRYQATSEHPPNGRGKLEVKLPPTDEAKISQIEERMGATMADCCAGLGDPVQTDAMLKFAQGKLSYAEMRGLCG